MKKKKLMELIDSLPLHEGKSFEEALADHLIANGVDIPTLTAQNDKIAVETPLGRLEACFGGDPQSYPEIFIYIVRPDCVEIDLVACEVKIEEDIAQAYLYGDTETEQWTRSHQWTRDDIYIDCD